MPGWHGPRGECGCCPGCECSAGGFYSIRNARLKVTVNVTITEATGGIAFRFGIGPGGSEYRYLDLSGFQGLNGTYFWELPTDSNGCIDSSGSFPVSPDPVFYTHSLTHDNPLLEDRRSSDCSIAFSSTNDPPNNGGTIRVGAGFSADSFITAGVTTTSPGIGWPMYELLGQINLGCPNFDWQEADPAPTCHGLTCEEKIYARWTAGTSSVTGDAGLGCVTGFPGDTVTEVGTLTAEVVSS